MGIIRQLPPTLVNKIAAGEVVERPASVVKELLENSLDAGPTRIVVTVEEGGKKLIRVTDDGGGIAPEDLRLAVSAHATSKLDSEDDLFAIDTLGFRGEALASIGAVSHLRVVSRRADSLEGGQIEVSGEIIGQSIAAGAPQGTSVEVRDLFFNVPARRKFLRSDATEMGQISEQFIRLALAHPHVGFELSHNVRSMYKVAGGQSLRERIAVFFGRDLAEEVIPIQRAEGDFAIDGFAAPPARSRSTGSWQYLFVNGRFIRDRSLQYMMREAYRGLMEHDRQPVVFLFLTVDPASIDVNVHPTKIEVRWRDSALVRSQVLSSLREALQASELAPVLNTASRYQPPADTADQDRVRAEAAAWFKNLPMPPAAPADGPLGVEPFDEEAESRFPQVSSFSGGTGIGPAQGPPSVEGGQDRAFASGPTAFGNRAASEYSWQPPIGPTRAPTDARLVPTIPLSRTLQLHNTYLVAETDEGMMIVDQHALHERVIYEQLRQRTATGALESQRMLLPEVLPATPSQLALVEGHTDLLFRLGIELTAFGHDSIAVQAFPVMLKQAVIREVVTDLLEKLAENPDAAHGELLLNDILSMMACKAAVKAGDPLTPEEIEALLAQRNLVDKGSNCPHGRPTALRISVRDLEKQFKRT